MTTGSFDAGLEAKRTGRESQATWWALAAFIVGGIATGVLMGGERQPLGGTVSLGSIAGSVAAVLSAPAFAVSFLRDRRAGRAAWRRRLPGAKRVADLVAMTSALMMLAYLIVVAAAELFQLGFVGLTVDPVGGGALGGAACAAMVYIASLSGSEVNASGLAGVVLLVLFMGTVASMITAPDASWWQVHFSQLGNDTGMSGSQFNLALVLAGAVVTVLANYLAWEFERGLRARGTEPGPVVTQLAWLFAVIGLCLMTVGLVPDQLSFPVHVGAASGMVVVFFAFVWIALTRLPGLSRELVSFSIVVVAGTIAAAALWVPVGYYSLAGAEFVIAGLLFSWLMVFARGAELYGGASAESGMARR